MKPVLVINSGSSSLKFGLYVPGAKGDERLLGGGEAAGIGHPEGTLNVTDGDGKELSSEPATYKAQAEALQAGLAKIKNLGEPIAIAHRLVHGGPDLLDHQLITPAVLKTLNNSIHFAPLHLPASLKLIEAAGQAFPGLPQFACFDTVFHKTMPKAASHLPLPQEYWAEGVRRYGFHGLSYESIVHALGAAIPARVVVAHLGNGCSVTAIQDGRSVDTSMGLTPTGGVVMSARSGDLDPGVLLYLLRVKGLGTDELETLLNKQSGLVGIAGGTGDMRELETAADRGDRPAALALEIFYRTVAKTIAGYASVLGGVDALVFTGGIGEHSERTRQQISTRLQAFGIPAGNAMTSEEDLQIARHCRRLLSQAKPESTRK